MCKKTVPLPKLTLNKTKNESELDKKVQDIFDAEYKEQLKNRLIKELTELQYKLSKDLVPWIEERVDDYHVQRHFHKETDEERKAIGKGLKNKAINLLTTILSISNIKNL